MSDYLAILQSWKKTRQDQGIDLLDIPRLPSELYIGGLDLAERIDHSAFVGWRWDGRNLKHDGQTVWPHIEYSQILAELEQINERIPFTKIGYDATGNVGVGSFFSQNLPVEKVKLTPQTKLDCIRSVQFLLSEKIIQVKKSSELELQILEQEKTITDAGNISYKHPQGRHDDLFWAAAIGAYVAIPLMVDTAPPAIVSQADLEEEVDADTYIQNIMDKAVHKGWYGN